MKKNPLPLFFKKAIYQRVFFLILMSFMTPMTFKVMKAAYQGEKSNQYVQAQCLITKNELIKITDGAKLDVQYSFVVDGVSYESNRYQWGMSDFTQQKRGKVTSFLKNFPAGSSVDCYYDSNNPNDVVLKKGTAYKWYENLIMIVFFLFGLWGLFISIFYPQQAEKIFIPSDPS